MFLDGLNELLRLHEEGNTNYDYEKEGPLVLLFSREGSTVKLVALPVTSLFGKGRRNAGQAVIRMSQGGRT